MAKKQRKIKVESAPDPEAKDSATIGVKAQDLQVGDRVDLESCPYLHDHALAEFEYAEVAQVSRETPTCVAVTYEGIDQVGYDPNVILQVKKEGRRQFFTGKTGKEHEEIAEEGEDYCVFECSGEFLILKEDRPENTQRLVDDLVWNEWVRMRARSYEEAMKNAVDAMDQYRCKENGDPNWMDVVLIPAKDREIG